MLNMSNLQPSNLLHGLVPVLIDQSDSTTALSTDYTTTAALDSGLSFVKSTSGMSLTEGTNVGGVAMNNTAHELEMALCQASDVRRVSLAEAIACMISLLTVLENFVILAAITKGPRSLRKPPYWFIASLAAADLLTGLEVVLAIFVPVGTSPLSRIVLKGMPVFTFIVSINSLVLVSFDRYLRITRHMDYEKLLTRRLVIFLIAMSWITSLGAALVAPLLGWSCAEQHCCANDGICVCMRQQFGAEVCDKQCSQSFVPFTKSYILGGSVYFLISIIVMIYFYASLFKVVKKKTFGNSRSSSSSSTADTKAKGGQRFSSKREVQLTKTLIITLGIFVLCWLPVMALFVADLIITYRTDQLSKVFDYALVPTVINSFLNPIIYSVRLPRMRVTIQRIALPCIFGRSDGRLRGTTWVTNTSYDRSIRRKSVRRRIEKLKGGSDESSNASSRSASRQARSRLASNRSINSEMSLSRESTINTPLGN